MSKRIEEKFGDYIDVVAEPDPGLTGRFEVKLEGANATCVENGVLMDKSTSFLVGHGTCSNARFDLLGARDFEVEAIEEVSTDTYMHECHRGWNTLFAQAPDKPLVFQGQVID